MSLCRYIPVAIIAISVIAGLVATTTFDRSFLFGASIWLVIGISPVFFFSAIYSLMMWWQPDRPGCRNHKCNSHDYEFIDMKQMKNERIYLYRCKCGNMYAHRGKQFMEISDNGEEMPFMTIKWGRWLPDINQI